MTGPKQVFVISDLHLGGEGPSPDDVSGRGFRICTRYDAVADFIRWITDGPSGVARELVINGDFVDFLAEQNRTDPRWSPFTSDPEQAIAKLRMIADRARAVFDALGAFVAAGHRLVLLLGNHDIELSLPSVRQVLRSELGVRSGSDFGFVHDGEAYVVGDALIEHGNEYDEWNRVSHGQLCRLRATLSRGLEVADDLFEPPAGSHMVADVINPIKADYRFIDLLKPETGAAIPLLLALEPGYRSLLERVVRHRAGIAGQDVRRAVARRIRADISARADELAQASDLASPSDLGGTRSNPDPSPPGGLDDLLDDLLDDGAASFRAALPDADDQGLRGPVDISARSSVDRTLGMVRLLFSPGDGRPVDARLPALLQALRPLQTDRSFDPSVETESSYLAAAERLAHGRIRYVVFGHTHRPKKVELESGGVYLNSGTWADVLRFPAEMLSGPPGERLERLRVFVEAMKANDFSAFVLFRPTYVRLDLDDDGVVRTAELCHYEG